ASRKAATARRDSPRDHARRSSGRRPDTLEFAYPRVVSDIIAALRAHGVQHATGFIIGSKFEGHPERQAALAACLEAGLDVGNPTFTHPSLAATDVRTYLADIEANRPLIEALEKRVGQRAHYFRAPYLDEGNTEAERQALTHYLAAHNYQMVRVSIDF